MSVTSLRKRRLLLLFAIAHIHRADQRMTKPFRTILIAKDNITLRPGAGNGPLGFVSAFFSTLERDRSFIFMRDQRYEKHPCRGARKALLGPDIGQFRIQRWQPNIQSPPTSRVDLAGRFHSRSPVLVNDQKLILNIGSEVSVFSSRYKKAAVPPDPRARRLFLQIA